MVIQAKACPKNCACSGAHLVVQTNHVGGYQPQVSPLNNPNHPSNLVPVCGSFVVNIYFCCIFRILRRGISVALCYYK